MTQLNLAYFSPLPPARSGISDYSRELLPYLGQAAAVTLFVEDVSAVTEELQAQFPVRPLAAYAQARWSYDVALYQMGNSDHHEAIYQTSLRYPGVVVLHDYFLHHFVAHRTAGQANYPAYTRELAYVQGMAGLDLAWQIKMGQKRHPLFEMPLNDRLLDVSLGVIVHSHYVQAQVQAQRPLLPVQVIPELMERYAGQSCRHLLPWPEQAVIFASVGQVTAEKQVHLALRLFQQVRRQVPQAHYLIVGQVMPEVDLPGLVQELGLTDVVWITGHVGAWQAFVDWIHTADIVINLRYPTMGETSATALRAMAAAKPVIVFDHGWYGELPETAVAKVPPLDEAALLRAMLTLAQSAQKRRQMGETAVAYIETVCSPAPIAAAYVRFLQQTLVGIRRRYA